MWWLELTAEEFRMNSCILWYQNEIWKWADGSLVVGQKTGIIPKPEVMYCLIPLVWKIQPNPHRRTLANSNDYATRKHSGQIPGDWIHVKPPLWMLATFSNISFHSINWTQSAWDVKCSGSAKIKKVWFSKTMGIWLASFGSQESVEKCFQPYRDWQCRVGWSPPASRVNHQLSRQTRFAIII